MKAKQNGGLLIVRDAEGHLVRKVNAVAAAKDWLRLGEAGRKVSLEESRYMRRLRDILGMERKGGA